MSQELTQDFLKSLLDYDPATGHFWWKNSGRGHRLDRPAGCTHKARQYREIRLKIGGGDRLYKAHRLAFLWMTGEMPDMVDHVDGDPTNNAWCNLRPATYEENGQNSKRSKNNKSGLKGAWFHKSTGRWISGIGVGRKKLYLGLFDTAEEAHEAYLKAAKEMYGEFARAA